MGDDTTMTYIITVCTKNVNNFYICNPNIKINSFRFVDNLNIITNQSDVLIKLPYYIFKLIISFYFNGLVTEKEPMDSFKIKTLGTLMYNDYGLFNIKKSEFQKC